jgi:hypothetical protein
MIEHQRPKGLEVRQLRRRKHGAADRSPHPASGSERRMAAARHFTPAMDAETAGLYPKVEPGDQVMRDIDHARTSQ